MMVRWIDVSGERVVAQTEHVHLVKQDGKSIIAAVIGGKEWPIARFDSEQEAASVMDAIIDASKEPSPIIIIQFLGSRHGCEV